MTPEENTINAVTSKTEAFKEDTDANAHEELSEDIEVMGPGQILSEARKSMGLSQQNVAEKLNFRIALVGDIENELFDPSLPETFNRGYLRNYAKLVNVAQEDILASYEQLNVAKAQASELQSFSKGTEKLAENNRIMWISYLILAVLIGSTVGWWMQYSDVKNDTASAQNDEAKSETNTEQLTADTELNTLPVTESVSTSVQEQSLIEQSTSGQDAGKAVIDNKDAVEGNINTASESVQLVQNGIDENDSEIALLNDINETGKEAVVTNVMFTFSGDCWVNISDATGERIAWGVKKLGYIMKISGQAPFNVTLGKPELVAINFSGEQIDMSQFNRGNIAKFTLPIVE